MKKILVICGSPRPKGNTYKITQVFEEKLSAGNDYEFEYLALKKSDLQYCRGCLLCMKKGEGFCPCKDDALLIRDKLLSADGVIFTSPVYVHTVNAITKNFFDRFAFFCHQPHFIGKPALLITTTELSGSKETLDYMKFPVNAWGFKIIDTIDVVYPSYIENILYKKASEDRIEIAAHKYNSALQTGAVDYSLKKFIFFNLLKLKVTLHKDMLPYDYEYWQRMGWLDKQFFVDEKVSQIKSFIAKNLVKIKSKSILKKAGIILGNYTVS